EFLNKLRADSKLQHNMVFVMTTSNEEKDKIAAFNLNVSGYILKHFDTEKFISSIATLNSFWLANQYPESYS
ncbi:MAG: response regulator, partial [Bacteroidetes bacterium]